MHDTYQPKHANWFGSATFTFFLCGKKGGANLIDGGCKCEVGNVTTIAYDDAFTKQNSSARPDSNTLGKLQYWVIPMRRHILR